MKNDVLLCRVTLYWGDYACCFANVNCHLWNAPKKLRKTARSLSMLQDQEGFVRNQCIFYIWTLVLMFLLVSPCAFCVVSSCFEKRIRSIFTSCPSHSYLCQVPCLPRCLLRKSSLFSAVKCLQLEAALRVISMPCTGNWSAPMLISETG